jgi:adenosyl cobinamide kinase/adenosyl cobinamide phosphate guanylyltransferase
VITLVLGGVRSGKSDVAVDIARTCATPVTVVATALCPPGDADFARRIEQHRAARPAAWATIEEPRDLAGVLRHATGTVLVDALGTWVANMPDFAVDVGGVCDALVGRRGDSVLVSDEVGWSVHPPTEAGRQFVDAVGDCNRAVAAVADRVVLVVAGRVLELGAR